jgi:Holliday junction resolvasome RuvABC endonuclease subunit
MCEIAEKLEFMKTMAVNGRVSKEHIQRAVQAILSLLQPPEPNDVADAIAAAMCCANSMKNVSILDVRYSMLVFQNRG